MRYFPVFYVAVKWPPQRVFIIPCVMGHPVAVQLFGVPHGLLEVFNAISYKNEFQNPQIFHQRVYGFLPSVLL
jgi:hypothetical protein